MRAQRGLMLALLTVMVAVVVGGCGGSAPPPPPRQWFESGAIVSAETASAGEPALPADAASVRRITYVSRSAVDDSNTRVTGSVYVPRSAAPPEGFHVVAYGPAVTGTGPSCALPPEANAKSSAAIATLLKAGYVAGIGPTATSRFGRYSAHASPGRFRLAAIGFTQGLGHLLRRPHQDREPIV